MAPQPDGKSRPQFSQPFRQITSMIIVIGLCCLGAFMALPRVLPLFVANPILNGFIGGVFLIGVIACFWQVFQLIGSVRWIEGFVSGEIGDDQRATRLFQFPYRFFVACKALNYKSFIIGLTIFLQIKHDQRGG